MNSPELKNCLFCLQNHWYLLYMMELLLPEPEGDGQQSMKSQMCNS